MADNCHFTCRNALYETRQIVHIFGQGVAAPFRPVGIAMSPKVGRQYVKMGLQRLRNCVPATAVIAAAMDQDQGWSFLIAPVCIMQPKALRLVEATFWTGHRAFNPVMAAWAGNKKGKWSNALSSNLQAKSVN